MKANDITSAVKGATKDWCEQRQKEERRSRSKISRQHMYTPRRMYFSEVTHDILPDAYDHASGNGKYSVSKRQLYYACRAEFEQKTGRELEYQYFANTLLVQYMNRNPEKTQHWKLTADPRGTLTIPHATDNEVQCGTLAIEDYLRKANQNVAALEVNNRRLDEKWPSRAPGHRYQGVLYIEKEGFAPILKEARIAERYDLAILSCKGQSNVAARRLIDEVCGEHGLPLFVVHDFDKAGFEIAARLTTVSDWAIEQDRVAYDFAHNIPVHDLGLRIEDVEHYELESERCKGGVPDTGITPEERRFLAGGKRVELNALTSPQFVEWLEAKLSEHMEDRLIPSDDVLGDAYRRALAVAKINTAIEEAAKQAASEAKGAELPDNLRDEVGEIAEAEGQAWDQALYEIARRRIEAESDEQ